VAKLATCALVLVSAAIFAEVAFGQAQDPGVQSGVRTGTFAGITVSPGQPLIDLQHDKTGFGDFFTDGLSRFQDIESVSNSATGNNGLGPRFNSNQCSSCHAQPAVGGTGAAVNPQASFVSGGIAPSNTTPSFISADGPTREARFPFFLNSNGTVNTSAPNGGVEDLFTVAGRSDAGTCTSLAQPDFAQAVSLNNVIFRIPTPVFGVGLVENLDDSTLLINQTNNLANNLGIAGTFNRNGNDGTITRFGWKAQNKSAMIFAGEAYNVEMGITNQLFQNERPLPEEDQFGLGLPATCLNLAGTGYPEDTTNPTAAKAQHAAAVLDDVTEFANFMRFLAPPPPGPVTLNGTQVPAATIAAGEAVFVSIGCATCHNASPGTTQVSNFVPALSQQSVPAFSDLELHHMGSGLADNVSQGNAGGDQFRTAPLWGLGQRIFLLHDGRSLDLRNAINQHSSNGSEANIVVESFQDLNETQKQELFDFLRSL
jgi:CxxC motif-containing protein (DUF1111 family)